MLPTLVLSVRSSAVSASISPYLSSTNSEPTSPGNIKIAFLDVDLLPQALSSSCRLADYTLSDETQRAVQEDFVASRQQQQQGEGSSMTVEDLHQHLVLARLGKEAG